MDVKICPEDTLRILLKAEAIPDKHRVTKRGGEQVFVLCHSIKVYPSKPDKGEPREEALTIEGFFSVSGGHINQIKPDTELLWEVNAESLVDILNTSWQGPEQ